VTAQGRCGVAALKAPVADLEKRGDFTMLKHSIAIQPRVNRHWPLRSAKVNSEFKDYIFGMLFLKRLSDAYDEEREKYWLDSNSPQAEAEELSLDPEEYIDTLFVPEKARWDNLKNLHHDIGAELNKATEAIEEDNPVIDRVLTTIDFNIKNKLTDRNLRNMISHFRKYRLRNDDFENPDLLGSAYEYLIKVFADSAGKKGGEFCTPDEVVRLLVALINPSAGMKVYDPTVGSGGMLIQSRNYLMGRGRIRLI